MKLKSLITQHPEKIELRLAHSILYQLEWWDIEQMMKENWRWQ